MILVDTNVLLHAVNRDSPHYHASRSLLEHGLRQGERFALTWSVVYEFLRVSTHAGVFPQPLRFGEAWGVIDALLEGGVTVLRPTDEHADLVRAAVDELPDLSGNRFHDLHIALLMREHAARRIRTSDTDFHRLGWIEPVDPFRPR